MPGKAEHGETGLTEVAISQHIHQGVDMGLRGVVDAGAHMA